MQTQKNIFYNVLLALSQVLFPLITFPYLARVLGPEQIGVLNFSESVARYFVLLAALGIPIYGVREIAKKMNDKKAVTSLFFEIMTINIITTCLLSIVFFLCIELIPVIKVEKNLFYWSLVYFILQVFYFEWFFIGMKQFKYIAIRSFVIRLLFILIVFMTINKKSDYIHYMEMQVGLSIILSLINFKYLFKIIDISQFQFRHLDLAQHVKPLLILFLTIFSISIYFSLDTILLGFLVDNASVGYYSSSLKLTKLIIAVLGSITVAIFPQMINVYHNGGEEQFKAMVKKCFDLIVGLSLPLIILIIGLSKEIISLFLGQTFDRSIAPLNITAPLILIVSLSGIFGFQVLSALSKDKSILVSALLGMVVSILFSFLLMPFWKENGAAITILITELTVCLSFIYFSNKYFSLEGFSKIFIKNVFASIPYLIIIVVVKSFFDYYLYVILFTLLLFLSWFLLYQFIIHPMSIYKEQAINFFNKVRN